MKNNDMKWYMVRVATSKEPQAIKNLEFELDVNDSSKFVTDIVIPKETQFYLRGNKKIKREKSMFPGYILMRMLYNGELKRIIESTNFVIEIMGDKNGATPLTDKEVERIFKKIDENSVENKVEFLIGEKIEIIDGPFSNFTGTVKNIDHNKQLLTVDVMIFNRPTEIELKSLQVKKFY